MDSFKFICNKYIIILIFVDIMDCIATENKKSNTIRLFNCFFDKTFINNHVFTIYKTDICLFSLKHTGM